MTTKQDEYLHQLRVQIKKFYLFGSRESDKKDTLRNEIHGYFRAGMTLQAITREEFRLIVEEEHMSAFGTTVEQRRLERKLSPIDESPRWEHFEEPAYRRKRRAN